MSHSVSAINKTYVSFHLLCPLHFSSFFFVISHSVSVINKAYVSFFLLALTVTLSSFFLLKFHCYNNKFSCFFSLTFPDTFSFCQLKYHGYNNTFSYVSFHLLFPLHFFSFFLLKSQHYNNKFCQLAPSTLSVSSYAVNPVFRLLIFPSYFFGPTFFWFISHAALL